MRPVAILPAPPATGQPLRRVDVGQEPEGSFPADSLQDGSGESGVGVVEKPEPSFTHCCAGTWFAKKLNVEVGPYLPTEVLPLLNLLRGM